MRYLSSSVSLLVRAIVLITAFVAAAAAQSEAEVKFIEDAESGGVSYFTVALVVFGALCAAYFFWRRSVNKGGQSKYNYDRGSAKSSADKGSYTLSQADTEKDLEWLRKTRKPVEKVAITALNSRNEGRPSRSDSSLADTSADELNIDTKMFQEKMRKLQYARLPITSFLELTPARSYEPLQLSNDESLISAIDQVGEEFEEDEAVRELALRILTAFRTRNSIEALTQIALYDLSANLRSKAVSSLTDFDHESVFEAILLACADPTREVRAAAARGLFRLNFDRADAWTRIIETGDEYRMSHASRAAVEAGIVVKSFDRLVHEDQKVAYEAFTLVSLMVSAGETKDIFEAIENHRDERVRFALLHVLKTQKDGRTVARLQDLAGNEKISPDVMERVQETLHAFETVGV